MGIFHHRPHLASRKRKYVLMRAWGMPVALLLPCRISDRSDNIDMDTASSMYSPHFSSNQSHSNIDVQTTLYLK